MSNRACSIPNCGGQFQAKGLCREHYGRLWRTGSPVDLSPEVPCPQCGGEVPPKKNPNGPRATYCSGRCRARAAYLRHPKVAAAPRVKQLPDPLPCRNCQTVFQPGPRRSAYCSKFCQGQYLRRNNPRRCSINGCDEGHLAQGLCRKHYKAKRAAEGYKAPNPWNDARRDAYHRRRAAKKAAATGNPVRLADIAARDGWRCGICRKSVDPNLQWPTVMSKSLDHIVPLSLGGLHDPLNVQLAHLDCNTRKGAKQSETQLALIG